MDIFAAFATDEQKEVEGAWFDVPGGDARIKVARNTNPRYAKALVSTYEKYQKAPKTANTEKQQDADYNKLLAEYILLDWENISFKGEKLPYSVPSAERLLAIRDFRVFVQKCSEDFEAFRAAAEADLGNE